MSSFEYENIDIKIQKRIKDMFIINIVLREYRKENSMFFSKLTSYNQMGYIFNNSFHLLKEYMKCINCYSNYENNEKCTYCNYTYSNDKNCFFLNCRHIIGPSKYSKLKIKYNLNTNTSYYYDQRHKMNTIMKQEIYAISLHPDRIEKILNLSNDSWINLDDYI